MPVDILIAIILSFFTLNGMRKGFIKEISKIIGIILGIIISNHFGVSIRPYLSNWISYEPALNVACYFIIFVIIVAIIGIIAMILQKFFELILLGWLNKLLGLLLGLCKGLLIVSLFIFILEAIPQAKNTREKLNNESILYQVCNTLKEMSISTISISDETNSAKNKIEKIINNPNQILNP